MASTTRGETDAFENIRRHTCNEIRAAYPYLKTVAMNAAVEQVIVHLREAIEQQEPTMAASKLSKNPLSLPAKLRSNICSFVLSSSAFPYNGMPTSEDFFSSLFRDPAFSFPMIPTPRVPTICHVSRQTRAETLAMHYAQSVFYVCVEEKEMLGAGKWLARIGKGSAAMIRQIQFVLPVENERMETRHEILSRVRKVMSQVDWIPDGSVKVVNCERNEIVERGWLDEVD